MFRVLSVILLVGILCKRSSSGGGNQINPDDLGPGVTIPIPDYHPPSTTTLPPSTSTTTELSSTSTTLEPETSPEPITSPSTTLEPITSPSTTTEPITSPETTQSPVTDPPPAPPPMIPLVLTRTSMYHKCGAGDGRGRTCFGFPNGCLDTEKCLVAATIWQRQDEDVDDGNDWMHVALVASIEHGYASIGFSTDRYMGDDAVVTCIQLPTGPQMTVLQSYNDNYRNYVEKNEGSVQAVAGYAQDNRVMGCIFRMRTIFVSERGNKTLDLFNEYHHILLAYGRYNNHHKDRKFGKLNHHYISAASEEAITIKDLFMSPRNLASRSESNMHWHEVTGILIHVFLLPCGIFIAKYGQETFSHSIRPNIPLWLVIHTILLTLAVILVLVNFVVIFVEYGWRSVTTIAIFHSILGSLSMTLIIIDCIIGIVLGFIEEEKRSLLNWTHWALGNISISIGMFNLLFATEMRRAHLPCIFTYLVGLFIFIHIMTHVIMSFHSYWLVYQVDSLYDVRRTAPGPMIPFKPPPDETVEKFHKHENWEGRRMAVVFYFLICFVCSVGMICLVLNYPVIVCQEYLM